MEMRRYYYQGHRCHVIVVQAMQSSDHSRHKFLDIVVYLSFLPFCPNPYSVYLSISSQYIRLFDQTILCDKLPQMLAFYVV